MQVVGVTGPMAVGEQAIALLGLRHLPDIDRWTVREAEFACTSIIGFNFGDGHLHDEDLLAAIQKRCRFEPGEFLVAWVESQPSWAGIVPGLLHDHCSAIHPMAVGSPVFARLRLPSYGLEWRYADIDCAHVLDGGTAAALHRDVDATAAGLGVDGPPGGACSSW